MAADFDEYAYLEQQLEGKRPTNGHAPPAADRERSRDKDKERERERPRDHDRDRQRPRSQRRDDREREDRERIRDRFRDEREGDRPRDDRYRERERERPREFGISRPRDDRHRQRERSPPRRREKTPPEIRAAREAEKELRAMERSTRTVFAYNLSLKADERQVFEFFSQAGTVNDVKIITDKNTRRSKGFAYVEMSRVEEVMAALALTGQPLLHQPVMVKSSEAEKNLAWEVAEQAKQSSKAAEALLGSTLGAGASQTASCRLMVSGLLPDVGDAELNAIFSPFGALEAVQVVRDAVGNSSGYGYVTFTNAADATRGMQHWQGRELAGKLLNISVAPAAAAAPPAAAGAAAAAAGMGDLDEDEQGGGMKLTSQARAALMSRLATSAGLQAPAPALPAAPASAPGPAPINPALALEQGLLGPASPIATPCLLLKNMFDPSQEVSIDFDQEISNDVQEECSKYGSVVHVWADRTSKGFVYLKFADANGAAAAQRALHGRFFAGRQLSAEFQFLHPYNQHFRC